jgi:hypothetical protein
MTTYPLSRPLCAQEPDFADFFFDTVHLLVFNVITSTPLGRMAMHALPANPDALICQSAINPNVTITDIVHVLFFEMTFFCCLLILC